MCSENSDDIQQKVIRLEFPTGDSVCSFMMELDLNEYSQKSMWNYFNQGKLYEPETSRMLCTLLKPGDTFIDAGGHVGYFSLLAASIVGQHGNVFTFEPEISNRQKILNNTLNNRFANIQVCEFALGDREADLTFYINADNDGGHALWDISTHDYNEKSREHLETREVHQSTLDHYFQHTDLGNLSLIKMDIEGSEFNALKGGRETLLKYHLPTVIMEMNRFALSSMGSSEDQVRDYMRGLGYLTYFPSEEGIMQLQDGHYIDANYVFNLMFAAPGRI